MMKKMDGPRTDIATQASSHEQAHQVMLTAVVALGVSMAIFTYGNPCHGELTSSEFINQLNTKVNCPQRGIKGRNNQIKCHPRPDNDFQ
jgi:hypothetical protein